MIQMFEDTRRPSFSEKLGRGVGGAASSLAQSYAERVGQQERQQQAEDAVKKLTGMDVKGLPMEFMEKVLGEGLQQKGRENKSSIEELQNQRAIEALANLRNIDPEKLKGLDVKTAETATRPSKEPVRRLSEKPIDPEQKRALNESRSEPGFNEMDEVEQYRTMVDKGVSPELAEKEAKLTSAQLERRQKGFESSYKAQEDFINQTTDKYRAFESETKPRLLQMQKLASDDDLVSPTAAAFLESLGIPYGVLEDPSSELYNKLSLDLLKGLPETYGSRIMKVEVDNFLKTIPALLNSADGRRMIASNMLKLGEMKEVYYNEMRKQQTGALDNNKPLPRDFQQRVFDQVKPQINRINDQFVKMSEIKSVPKGTIPFFNPNGDIEFVPKEHAQWAMENGGRRIW